MQTISASCDQKRKSRSKSSKCLHCVSNSLSIFVVQFKLILMDTITMTCSPSCGFIVAQLVRVASIAEVICRVRIPLKPNKTFTRLLFCNCLNHVHNRNDHNDVIDINSVSIVLHLRGTLISPIEMTYSPSYGFIAQLVFTQVSIIVLHLRVTLIGPLKITCFPSCGFIAQLV